MVEHINKVAGTGGENGTRRCLRAMERGGISACNRPEVVRTVTENGRTLKSTSQCFEKE